jgi:hypothetical protein
VTRRDLLIGLAVLAYYLLMVWWLSTWTDYTWQML